MTVTTHALEHGGVKITEGHLEAIISVPACDDAGKIRIAIADDTLDNVLWVTPEFVAAIAAALYKKGCIGAWNFGPGAIVSVDDPTHKRVLMGNGGEPTGEEISMPVSQSSPSEPHPCQPRLRD